MGARISPRKRELAAQRLALGRPAEEVASTVGVAPSTLRRWRARDPEFRKLIGQYEGAAMLRGLEVALAQGGPVRAQARRGASPSETAMAPLVELGGRDMARVRPAPRRSLTGEDDDLPPAA